jgi:pimeloyl-ACP methyl ester carboxylesterase
VTVDAAEILVGGPWRHRLVSANGARFHVVEGLDARPPDRADGRPLVVLLHGFPQFWWVWRQQLPVLAQAGHRVVAMDLRGYGASDKPPRGYDTQTLAADVAGVVRALGESEAVIVGHDWGGWVAWAMPALQPRITRAIAVVSMGHPLTMRSALLHPVHWRCLGRLLAFQVPWVPERHLTRHDGVAELLEHFWGRTGAPTPQMLQRYQRAMRLPFVAATSVEYFRRALRSAAGRQGRTLVTAVERSIDVPVLQVHGGDDRWIPPALATASRRWVQGPLEARILPGLGHFVPEEAPAELSETVVDWLARLPSRVSRGHMARSEPQRSPSPPAGSRPGPRPE